MTADLLRRLELRGVRLKVDGGTLQAEGTRGAVTPDLADLIRIHKADLLAHVSGPGPSRTARTRTPPFGEPWLGQLPLTPGRLYFVATPAGYVTFIRRRGTRVEWRHDWGTGEGTWAEFERWLEAV